MSVKFDSPTPYSEEWWRVTLSSIGDAVVVTDAVGRVTFMNPVAQSLTGWTNEEANSRPLEEVFPIIHEWDRVPIESPVSKVLQTGEVVELANHTILVAKNGAEFPLADSAAPIRDAQGNIFGVVLVFRDITEHKRAEATRLQLAAIIESADDAIISKSLDGIVTSWNRGAERMYGYTAAEVVGKSISLLVPADRVDETPAILERMKRGERIEHYETVRRRKDGTLINVSLSISPLQDSEGHIIGAAKIARDITERKHAETEHAHLAAIVESSDDAIVSKTLESIITSWNKGAERIFGYTAAEAVGKSIYLIIPPERHSEEQMILDKLKRAERIEHFETVRMRKDGQRLDISLSVSPIKDSTGRVIGASKIARDITERKHTEQQLAFLAQASELLSSSLDYETTLKSLAHLAVPQFGDWCSVDMRRDDRSIQRVAIAHLNPDKIALAEEFQRNYPPDPEAPVGVPNVLRTGQPELYPEIADELLVQRAKDVRQLELLRAIGVKSAMIVPLIAGGRTLGTLSFVIGESERRYTQTDLHFAQDLARRAALAVENARLYQEAQAALLKREEALELHRNVEDRLSVLVEASGTLLGTMQLADVHAAVLDLAKRLISADAYAVWRKQPRSDAWRIVATVGLSEAFQTEEISAADYRQSPTLQQPIAIEDVKRLPWLSARQATYQTEGITSLLVVPLHIQTEFAGTITFYYRQARQFSETEIRVATALANLAASAINTTELYETQSRLRSNAEEANRLKDDFLATVSHELRTPLNAILGWAKVLHDRKLDAPSAHRAIETIVRSANAQNQIIGDILDVSRIISGRLRLSVQQVELSSLIEMALETVRPAAEAKGVQLQSILDTTTGFISGHPERLQQVIWNLLSNAVKFTPKTGRVQVRLQRVDSLVEIVVSDTGQGIKREFLPHVFDRFRQADSSSTRTHGGLGLGLAIVRHLVELHGGTVRAESPGEHQGAAFTVRLPVTLIQQTHTLPERAVQEESSLRAAPDLTGLTVLVVDDEPDARELLTTLLEQYGAQVSSAGSAKQALSLLEQKPPEILVSDIGMPDEDGYELIRKARERGIYIPALALTAYARAEDRLRALSAGYQMHVAKPIDPIELAVTIASLAGRLGRK